MALKDAREIVDFMKKEGRAEWVGPATGKERDEGERNVAWIWWRTPDEWAGVIADWVSGLWSLL